MIGIAVAVIVVLAAAGYVATTRGVAPVFGSQANTIGFVDMTRALNAHPNKAAAESALRDFAQAQIADAQAKMKTMTPAQKQDLQRQVDQTIFNKRAELLGGLDNDIRAAIQKVAAQQGIAVVLDRTVGAVRRRGPDRSGDQGPQRQVSGGRRAATVSGPSTMAARHGDGALATPRVAGVGGAVAGVPARRVSGTRTGEPGAARRRSARPRRRARRWWSSTSTRSSTHTRAGPTSTR